jgi:hypothetical protein
MPKPSFFPATSEVLHFEFSWPMAFGVKFNPWFKLLVLFEKLLEIFFDFFWHTVQGQSFRDNRTRIVDAIPVASSQELYNELVNVLWLLHPANKRINESSKLRDLSWEVHMRAWTLTRQELKVFKQLHEVFDGHVLKLLLLRTEFGECVPDFLLVFESELVVVFHQELQDKIELNIVSVLL